MRTHNDGNLELKSQIVPGLGVLSLITGMLVCLSFSVWNTSLDPTLVGVQMTILPKSLPCESVFATCSAMGSLFSVHAQSCVNKQKSLAVPLVWTAPREQNTWFLMRQILSHRAFSKPPVLCCPSVGLVALLSLCRVFHSDGFSVIPEHSSSSSREDQKTHGEFLRCWWHLVAPKHYTLHFLSSPVLC